MHPTPTHPEHYDINPMNLTSRILQNKPYKPNPPNTTPDHPNTTKSPPRMRFALMEVAAAMDAATFIVGVHGGYTRIPNV